MTDKLLEEILGELSEIRLLLANGKTQSTTPAAQPAPQATGYETPPQPSALVADPGAVEVHFGKNAGKRIDDLTERQLGWYAAEQPPRLDNTGKPFPPRPQDVALRNACRQLWHSRNGSLKSAPQQTTQEAGPAARPVTQDEVPF